MSQRNAILGLVGVCLFVILLSVGGLVADFATRLEFDIDGLLLALICLMMGGVFTLMLGMIAKEAGWLPQRSKKPSAAEAKAPVAAPAANPGKPSTGQSK